MDRVLDQKIKKVVECRSDTPAMLEALQAIAVFYGQQKGNTAEARKSLRQVCNYMYIHKHHVPWSHSSYWHAAGLLHHRIWRSKIWSYVIASWRSLVSYANVWMLWKVTPRVLKVIVKVYMKGKDLLSTIVVKIMALSMIYIYVKLPHMSLSLGLPSFPSIHQDP